MTNATAKTTYQAVGNKEDLVDVVTNISPTDTLFLNKFGQSEANGVYHEWTTDSLAAAADNAQIEGSDYTFSRVASRTRTGAYTQIFVTPVEVSETQRVVNKAGVEDEFAYQMAKKMKEHARDIEISLATGTGNSGASGTARRLKGVYSWISTVNITGTGTGSETLTEDMFSTALQNIWEQGGEPMDAFAAGFQKRKISAFAGGTTKMQVVTEEKKVINAVDVYMSDFGRIRVHAHRWTPADHVGILTLDLWKVAYLRRTKKYDVARVGSATRGVIESELTLEARQEAGSGKITQLSTS